MTLEEAKKIRACDGMGYSTNEFVQALQMTEPNPIVRKGCKDCWHNYHCPMPQEGYDFNPDICPHNPDKK